MAQCVVFFYTQESGIKLQQMEERQSEEVAGDHWLLYSIHPSIRPLNHRLPLTLCPAPSSVVFEMPPQIDEPDLLVQVKAEAPEIEQPADKILQLNL